MLPGGPKKTRSERVAAVALPPRLFSRMLDALRRGDVLVRLGLCALTAIILAVATRGWAPPLAYRKGDVPQRDVLAHIGFEKIDPAATREARDRARSLALSVYDQDLAPLEQLQAKLQNTLTKAVGVASVEEFGWNEWAAFEPVLAPGTPQPSKEDREKQFQRLQEQLTGEGNLEKYKKAIDEAFVPLRQKGLLYELDSQHQGNLEKIFVQPKGTSGFATEVPVSEVLVGTGAALQKSLAEKLPSLEVADRIFAWLKPQLPTTLALNVQATKAEQDRAAAAVEEKPKAYPQGTLLAKAGLPLDDAAMELLTLEHQTALAQRSATANLYRLLAVLGMFVALYTLCGIYIGFREPILLESFSRFVSLLAMVVAAVVLALVADHWKAASVPLLLFGMTLAIAYHQELALLLSAAVALVVVFSLGQGIVDLVILVATASAAILSLRSVRTRSKLLYVGICAGTVAIFTTLGVGTLDGQPFYPNLLFDALRFGLYAVIAGSLMTCLLPFIERAFDVQTDISLIELGDPAHPLLQELVRRAPGTYNHSITVASLAESAAEAIGARGLLVRVGAYFHDIGKMLKPGYFAENQGQGDNRHDSLVPAMSTLVIIAHVKDGADLARQHRLPERIIDFIQQHHGTTLVEYFYHQASQQSKQDPDRGEVDESAFRYPGPKPQTKEAGVLMLADAVESASRALSEPTPARIESLVEDLVRKRLMDGQFDESGLTLSDVHTIQESLVKSLTAVYHGRVKYPDQRTA